MKLRNFIYATMVACAFASCSEDEIPGQGENEEVKGEAALSVNLADIVTKANANDSEATIKSLTAYIFTGNTLDTKVDISDLTNREEKDIAIQMGPKKVFVLANQTPDIATYDAISSLDNLELANEGKDEAGFTMNSQVFEFTASANTHYYLGYTDKEVSDATVPSGWDKQNVTIEEKMVSGTKTKVPVQLYRNVAKIHLNNIKADLDDRFGENAKVVVTDVFMLHGKKNSLPLPAQVDEWGSTEVTGDNLAWLNGAQNGEATNTAWGTYQFWVNIMTEENVTKFKEFFNPLTGLENYDAYRVTPEAEVELGDNTTTTFADNWFYAYEYAHEPITTTDNGDGNSDPVKTYTANNKTTMLVVAAKIVYEDETETAAEGEDGTTTPDYTVRYYPVSVGIDGLSGDALQKTILNEVTRNKIGVLRNMQYNISLTIKGAGYETPFGPGDAKEAILDIKCEVVPFGEVDQSVEI